MANLLSWLIRRAGIIVSCPYSGLAESKLSIPKPHIFSVWSYSTFRFNGWPLLKTSFISKEKQANKCVFLRLRMELKVGSNIMIHLFLFLYCCLSYGTCTRILYIVSCHNYMCYVCETSKMLENVAKRSEYARE